MNFGTLAILCLLIYLLHLSGSDPNCKISVSEPAYTFSLNNSHLYQTGTLSHSQCALTATLVVELKKNKSSCHTPRNVLYGIRLSSNSDGDVYLNHKTLPYFIRNTSSEFVDSFEFCLTEQDLLDIAGNQPPFILQFYYQPWYASSAECVSSSQTCGRKTNTSLVRVEYDNPPTVQFNITSDGKSVLLQRESSDAAVADSRHLNWSVESLRANSSHGWVELAVHLFDTDVFDDLSEKFRYSVVTSVNVTVVMSLLLTAADNQAEGIQQATVFEFLRTYTNDSTHLIANEKCGLSLEIANRSDNYITLVYRSCLTDVFKMILKSLSPRAYETDNTTEVSVNVSYKLHASVTTGLRRPQSSSATFTLIWKVPEAVLPEGQFLRDESSGNQKCRILEIYEDQIKQVTVVLYCLSAVCALLIVWIHSAVNKRQALLEKIQVKMRKGKWNLPNNIVERMRKGKLILPDIIVKQMRKGKWNLPEATSRAITRTRGRKGRQNHPNRTQSDKVQVYCSYIAPRCMPGSDEVTEEVLTLVTTNQGQRTGQNLVRFAKQLEIPI